MTYSLQIPGSKTCHDTLEAEIAHGLPVERFGSGEDVRLYSSADGIDNEDCVGMIAEVQS